ncbi:hypothetical protein F5882DRAFT_61012 [Hyaloscypha sp. PMI_1271]|nr:hypothetical protein F5882DRAFT_61012 [Hyaloscypha sp. PMI_1271]
MFPCTSVGPREVDDTHYDASEEESICEIENEGTPVIDLAIPIPEATQPRSISEPMPTRETSSGKRTALCPHPVLTGYLTSEDEEHGIGGKASATRQRVRKTRAGQRRASWSPQPPLTPRRHDSGVQGLDDSDTCTETVGSGDGNGEEAARHWRKITTTELDVLNSTGVGSEGEDEGLTFKGIADADSSEERWRQIVLEEHMDKIFHALPTLLDEELKETVVDRVVVRASFETTEEWGIPRRKQTGLKERMLTLVRLFGFSTARKARVL